MHGSEKYGTEKTVKEKLLKVWRDDSNINNVGQNMTVATRNRSTEEYDTVL